MNFEAGCKGQQLLAKLQNKKKLASSLPEKFIAVEKAVPLTAPQHFLLPPYSQPLYNMMLFCSHSVL